jgi:hydrogenase maturation protease
MFVPKMDKGLLIGIGNAAMGDDGLGWALADAVKEFLPKNLHTEYRYQLQVEDAMMVSDYDMVIFADASEEDLPGGFAFTPCYPAAHYFFSSHQQSPETILYLGEQLYQKKPTAFVLALSGYTWELGEELSPQAKVNLESAVQYLQSIDFQILTTDQTPISKT